METSSKPGHLETCSRRSIIEQPENINIIWNE